jgi:hypothetical protein
MVAARTAVHGLSTSDLDQIRGSLAVGRKPRVMFTSSAGQIAGQSGQVVRLDDPAGHDDWVVVRFGRDELPFSPADLQLPLKAPRARRGGGRDHVGVGGGGRRGGPPGGDALTPAPGPPMLPATATPPAPVASKEPPMSPAKSRRDPGAELPASPERPRAASRGSGAVRPGASPRSEAASGSPTTVVAAVIPPDAPSTDTPAGSAAPFSGPARPTTARRGRPKPPVALTVTLTYAAGAWAVGASQGTKVLAKPQPVRAADALRMVAMLDVPAVRETVEGIVSAARAEAEREADRLRSELAEIEARLAELGKG